MTTGKILGEKYIINGQPADVSGLNSDTSVDVYYEVVRLIDSKVLFLDDHLKRLNHSISGSGLDNPGDEEILESLKELHRINNLTVGNIRICLEKGKGNTPDLICYFVPYYYPDECTYLSGVQLVSYPHQRPNPGIKKLDIAFRESVAQHIRSHGVYEAILINEKNEITEGSRSNVFFIDPSDRLISPPENEILPGISRKYVLDICSKNSIEIVQRPVHKSELDDLVSCFISGTSPKVLPVWQLDGFQFRTDHPILKNIMTEFDALINENLKTIV
jgi:branched-chain amino acid aminotransferase